MGERIKGKTLIASDEGQGPVGLDELNRLGKPHGIQFFDELIAELKQAYDLRVIGE